MRKQPRPRSCRAECSSRDCVPLRMRTPLRSRFHPLAFVYLHSLVVEKTGDISPSEPQSTGQCAGVGFGREVLNGCGCPVLAAMLNRGVMSSRFRSIDLEYLQACRNRVVTVKHGSRPCTLNKPQADSSALNKAQRYTFDIEVYYEVNIQTHQSSAFYLNLSYSKLFDLV